MKVIVGKNINLRTVEVADAEFILELRMLENKNMHLSKVDNDLLKQQAWLKEYKHKEQQGLEYYFVVESKQQEKLGLVRVYDLQNDSFCWGSWLIKNGAPKTTAIESALQVYEFGFGTLGFEMAHFDVRKDNKRVVEFHLRFGSEITSEDDSNFYFNYQVMKYQQIKQKYKRYLH